MVDEGRNLRECAEQGLFQATIIEPEPVESRDSGSRCTTIAVCSGKGGVGKTMLSLSLAVAFARMKKRVLLIDADFGLANVHLLLGMAPRRTLRDVIEGSCSVGETIENGPVGIHLLPGASGFERMANLGPREVAGLQRQFEGFERDYDYAIIDTAAGIGAPVTGLARHADLPLVVVTPEPTSLADGYSMIKALDRCGGAGQIGVLGNMAPSEREAIETFDRLNALVVKFLKRRITWYGALPFDHDVARSVRRQQPLIVAHPLGGFSQRLQKVAWKIGGAPGRSSGGFFTRLLGRSAAGAEGMRQ